jgi:L-ascorbate metabolism protein UlaG (beta-lactamase superfamily)
MHPFAHLVVPAGSVGIHWFEQSAYAIRNSQTTTVQIDPYYPAARPAEKFIHPQAPLIESELPTDYVLMTHAHSDHTNSETIARIHRSWPDATYIGPKESIEQILRDTEVGQDHTISITAEESITADEIIVHAFYSKPPAGDPEAGIHSPDVTHLGYVIEMEGVKLYFTGDPINTFADLDELIAPIAALEPDIGFAEGILLARKLGLKTAVPSHYACFVKRTFDPQAWAALFPASGPRPLIIPRNSHIVYPVRG